MYESEKGKNIIKSEIKQRKYHSGQKDFSIYMLHSTIFLCEIINIIL